jgi:hypothetical protein
MGSHPGRRLCNRRDDLLLLAIGAGFGLSTVSPWPGIGVSATTFAVMTAIWLVIVQWISSGIGGYVAGRLRTRWTGLHTQEVHFRDTAHGIFGLGGRRRDQRRGPDGCGLGTYWKRGDSSLGNRAGGGSERDHAVIIYGRLVVPKRSARYGGSGPETASLSHFGDRIIAGQQCLQ